jgi:hypothetical protein
MPAKPRPKTKIVIPDMEGQLISADKKYYRGGQQSVIRKSPHDAQRPKKPKLVVSDDPHQSADKYYASPESQARMRKGKRQIRQVAPAVSRAAGGSPYALLNDASEVAGATSMAISAVQSGQSPIIQVADAKLEARVRVVLDMAVARNQIKQTDCNKIRIVTAAPAGLTPPAGLPAASTAEEDVKMDFSGFLNTDDAEEVLPESKVIPVTAGAGTARMPAMSADNEAVAAMEEDDDDVFGATSVAGRMDK